jgi:hypothetical protein
LVISICAATHARALDENSAPNSEELAKAGKATKAKLQSAAAVWDVKYTLPNGTVRVNVVRDKERKAWLFRVGSNEVAVCSVVQTGGFWYALESQTAVKTRPWEAELHLPGGYLFLRLADLQILENAADLAQATFRYRRGTRLYYGLPLSSEDRTAAQKVISDFEKIGKAHPKFLNEPDTKKTLKLAHDELENGMPFAIEEKTGIVLENKIRNVPIAVESFQFLDQVSPTTFAIEKDVKWDDQSTPWPKSDLARCIMVTHDPLAESGGNSRTLDGYVLNLETGKLRRLPHAGIATVPGCFLHDRSEVIGSGTDLDGHTGIFKWNLLTGQETRISDGLIAMAELSPDGRTLAIMRITGDGVDPQMQLIDLETRKERPLGKLGHIGGPIGWLPDGDGLILKRFEATTDRTATERPVVCRLGMDGKVSDLRYGDSPIVLRKSKKILFQDNDSGLWKTCEFDGTKPQIYADGMKGYDTPVVSPDESQIIFAKYENGKLPQLLLFDWSSTNGKALVKAEGFTGIPVWR